MENIVFPPEAPDSLPGPNGVAPTEASRAHWNIFLQAPATPAEQENAPHFLAHLLGLDVYGKSLLSRRAAVEMSFIAIILVVIFLFDFLAWSLLFNAVIHSDAMAVDSLTLFAMVGGALFALAVLIYERQFVTADTSAGWRRVIGPTLLRLSILTVSALITAQPIELLLFRGTIKQRTHEEGIRQYASGLLPKLNILTERKDETEATAVEIDDSYEATILDALEEKVIAQKEAINKLKGQRETLRRELRDWTWAESSRRQHLEEARRNLASVRDDPETLPEALLQAQQAYDEALRRHRYAAGRKNHFGAELRKVNGDRSTDGSLKLKENELAQLESDRQAAYDNYQGWREKKREQIDEGVGKIIVERAEVQQWLQRVVSSNGDRSKSLTRKIDEVSYEYTPLAYDFFEQLRVLDDLRKGRFARWPGSSTVEIRRLADEFGIRDLENCDDIAAAHAEGFVEERSCTRVERQAWDSFKERARLFEWSWRIVYAIAIIIPLLVIAIKLLLPAELNAYYSNRHQAAAGNPEAMTLMTVNRVVDHDR